MLPLNALFDLVFQGVREDLPNVWQDKFGADEAKKRLEQGASSPNRWPALRRLSRHVMGDVAVAGKERSSCGRLGLEDILERFLK